MPEKRKAGGAKGAGRKRSRAQHGDGARQRVQRFEDAAVRYHRQRNHGPETMPDIRAS